MLPDWTRCWPAEQAAAADAGREAERQTGAGAFRPARLSAGVRRVMGTLEEETRFLEDLVSRFPTLAPLYREHIADNDELLPHVFCFTVVGYLTTLYLLDSDEHRRGGKVRRINNGLELQAILSFIEAVFVSRSSCRNLISVSILEDLPRPDEPGGGLRQLLGPYLRAELQCGINRD